MTNLEQLLVTALRNAFDELNAIRARDGTPYHRDDGIPYSTEEYFSSVVEECSAAIEAATGEIPRPWGFSWEMSEAGSHAFIAALLNPPEPNEALKHAAEIYKKRIKSYEDIEHVSADTTSHATLASAISASIARIVAEEDEVARLRAVLKAYEAWEAALIMDPVVWRNGLPQFTQSLYDKFIEIQTMRNAALEPSDGS